MWRLLMINLCLYMKERGHEVADYIPGIPPTRLEDLHSRLFPREHGDENGLQRILETVSEVSKAQYLLFTSADELESQVFDVLKTKYTFPVYPIGPTIPYFQLENSSTDTNHSVPDYIRWLDSQPKTSVLYISFGSIFSVSSAQLDEIIAGLQSSGKRHMWVARENSSKIKDSCGDFGFVVPWCDQLRVLCHPSIGGFWTHCGWNSTLEAFFAGVPMLTFPLATDQIQNSKQIVEDWKVGYKVKKAGTSMTTEQSLLITRDEVSELVKRFMDPENNDGKEMRKRAKEIQKYCQQTIAKGGSSDTNLDAFIRDISQGLDH